VAVRPVRQRRHHHLCCEFLGDVRQWINAAAMVALFDPDWARSDRRGDMVRLLARDWASPDRDDPLFPFLRTFDPYAGHSWASGGAPYADGNNQEASSEAIVAWASLILFGAATGDTPLRDLGIWGNTLETNAARLYWFGEFPAEYGRKTIARLWGSGGDHVTWWTANPEEVHGINFLPMTAASLYLGHDAAYVQANLAEMERENGGPAREWADIIAEYQTLADPAGTLARWDPQAEPEFGEMRSSPGPMPPTTRSTRPSPSRSPMESGCGWGPAPWGSCHGSRTIRAHNELDRLNCVRRE